MSDPANPKPADTAQYDALLAEVSSVEELTKTLNEQEKTDGEANTKVIEENADEATAEAANKGDEGKKSFLGKSLGVTLENGEAADAIDADALVEALEKSLATQDQQSGQIAGLTKTIGSAIGALQALGKRVIAQDKLLKAMGNEGRGRKTAVTIHDRPSGGPAAPAGMTGEEMLTKSMDLLGQGKFSAADVSAVESALNRREAVPPALAALLNSPA